MLLSIDHCRLCDVSLKTTKFSLLQYPDVLDLSHAHRQYGTSELYSDCLHIF